MRRETGESQMGASNLIYWIIPSWAPSVYWDMLCLPFSFSQGTATYFRRSLYFWGKSEKIMKKLFQKSILKNPALLHMWLQLGKLRENFGHVQLIHSYFDGFREKNKGWSGGRGSVCERRGKVYPFRKTRCDCHDTSGCMILSKSRTWQKCTHAHTHCHHALTKRDMSAFSQFLISLLHLRNGILLIYTRIPKSQSKLRCTAWKEADTGQCE